MMVQKEFQQQRRIMQSVLAEVAQLEGTRTISGDYELKLQRQEYFLAKQKTVSVLTAVSLLTRLTY